MEKIAVTALLTPEEMNAVEVWRDPDAENAEVIRDLIIEGLHAIIRRAHRRAQNYAAGTRARLTKGGTAFTAERERQFTDAIKDRLLYEGAWDLPWPQYAAFRKKHGGEPLTKGDLAYLTAWTPCAVK
jgi:hypothetical protein